MVPTSSQTASQVEIGYRARDPLLTFDFDSITMNNMDHSEFVQKYKSGLLTVRVNKQKAASFVLSRMGNGFNRFAFLSCASIGMLLVVLVTPILLFYSWKYSTATVFLGVLLVSGTYKSVPGFVLDNMLEDPNFFKFVISNNGAQISEESGKQTP